VPLAKSLLSYVIGSIQETVIKPKNAVHFVIGLLCTQNGVGSNGTVYVVVSVNICDNGGIVSTLFLTCRSGCFVDVKRSI
jgi:hypothetical protein